MYEQQISQLKEDSQRALDQAAVENKVLQGQLEALENFRLNKDKLEAEMKDKETLLERMKEEHSEALYKLEKKAVLDKDRYTHVVSLIPRPLQHAILPSPYLSRHWPM